MKLVIRKSYHPFYIELRLDLWYKFSLFLNIDSDV